MEHNEGGASTTEAAYDARTSTQPTRTRTVMITQQVDEDGTLTVRIPVGADMANAILYVKVLIEEPIRDEPSDGIHPTAGSSPDFPLDADLSYSRENRQWLYERGMIDDPRLPNERAEEA
jgi:hypothetical protein